MKRFRDIFIGFILASAPILSLYRIGPLSVSLWLTLIAFIFLVKDKQYCLKPNGTRPILRLAGILCVLSLNGMLLGYKGMSLVYSIIIILLEGFTFLALMGASNPKVTLLFYRLIGYLCCLTAVYQCFVTISGLPHFTGRIPFLELDSSVAGWMKESWGFRFNSLFSECSYFAIFLLPLFAYSIKTKRYLDSLIYGFSLVLSSSTTGIFGICIVLLYEICYINVIRKREFKALIVIGLFVVVAGYFIVRNQEVLTMLLRTSNKVSELNEGASDDRLFGGVNLFFELPFKEQIFGVGLNQLANYFKMNGKDIPNYANTIVSALVNNGVIGLFFWIFYFINIFKISQRNNNQVFFYLYFAVSCADPLTFNHRFYQFLYFIVFINFCSDQSDKGWINIRAKQVESNVPNNFTIL